ncbi:Krueppel homolog 2 [Condylostylus longicornis]|uniref:Krueppel homolog 2 n=1 Tax=Condylostylus longicornis TaxID=2530218 RepID=UPI00244DCE4D|nr:Krueppel homolog 2 [Condylostylus longicornis]
MSADMPRNDESQQQEPSPPSRNYNGVLAHAKENKIDTAMLGTRILTIFFTILYVIPIFGNSQKYFTQALIANAATSALRLHQRLPQFALTREFLSLLLIEDSCHYLFYTVIFLYVSPVFLILLPIFLFAVLQSSSYTIKLLDILGTNSMVILRLIISFVEFQSRNILRLCAFSEIFLMPLCIILVFMGRAGLLTPFIYYHFLSMRYLSRRNMYTRQMFSELRMAVEVMARNSPPFINRILLGGISFVTRLAPQQQAA